MNTSADLARHVPNADDFLALPPDEQGRLLLKLLEPTTPEFPCSRHNFFNRAGDSSNPPKYGSQRQNDEIDPVLMGAWGQLVAQGYLAESAKGLGGHFFITPAGKHFLSGTSPPPRGAALSFISEDRLNQLRSLNSSTFDFCKLIRLCEELNTVYRDKCFIATAALTRALLDHVPPLFGKSSFAQVASNYGGGKSFKEAMHHLEEGARNIADEHLHRMIRQRETLPNPQQVQFGPVLDALLAEIVRIAQ